MGRTQWVERSTTDRPQKNGPEVIGAVYIDYSAAGGPHWPRGPAIPGRYCQHRSGRTGKGRWLLAVQICCPCVLLAPAGLYALRDYDTRNRSGGKSTAATKVTAPVEIIAIWPN